MNRIARWCVGIGLLLTPVVGRAELDPAAMQAYQVARNWLDRGAVPQETIAILVEAVAAVHVTLRIDGLTVGQGTVPAGETPHQPPATDLMALIADALSDAMRDARTTLTARGTQVDEGARITLDLQIARPLEPVKLENLRDLPGRIIPHAHGLAMRRDSRWAWSFPGNAVAANTDLNGRLNRLLSELNIPLDRKTSVGTADGPPLFRFAVIHITAPVAGGEPIQLYRGHELLPPEPLDELALALLGEQLADYLVQRQRDDGRFAGTYEPTADQYQPVTADVSATAYAAIALNRAAGLGGVSRQERLLASRRAAEALVGLIGRPDVAGPQIIGRDAEATALALWAILDSGIERKPARDNLTGILRGLVDGEGRLRANTAPGAPPVTPETQALGAAALVAAFDQTRDPKLLEVAQAALAAAWRDAQPSEAYRLMPWIALAEGNLARLQRPTDNRQRLVELCAQLWTRQVRSWGDARRPVAPDTVGGFIVGQRLFEEPTAESASVLAGLAACLRNPQVVAEAERIPWLVQCGLGGRFIHQLTLQPSGAYYPRNPREAIGGVRIALWDNRQPLRTTAAALLALTELRITLAKIAGQAGPH